MRNLFVLMLLMIVFGGVAAQDTPDAEPSPFRHALSLIPDVAPVREASMLFTYADYHAALESRGVEIPESVSAFMEDRDAYGPILPVLPLAGPDDLLTFLLAGGREYPATVGFDFFEVAQGIRAGVPPAMMHILIGDFSAESVVAAHTARDYTIETGDESGGLLCPPAGCDTGTKIDFENRLPGNPFGGALGRSELIFVEDGVLLNSTQILLVQMMTATYRDATPSLADAPEFQAMANVLDAYPHVMAVMAVSPLSLGTIDPSVANEEAQVQLSEGIVSQLESMPVDRYQIAAFASTADETNEYGLALFVYADADAAQEAAASIDQRLTEMSSFSMPQRTYAEILNDIGTLEPSTVVTDEATGLSVVVVRVSDALPLNEPDSMGMIPGSHVPYRRFNDMIRSRDTNWMIWGSRAE